MKSLLERTIPTAGDNTSRIAAFIRHYDYTPSNGGGIPDHRYTCSRLACSLINEMSNSNELNDRHIANDRACTRTDRQNAQTRIAQRTQLSAEIARLAFDDFRSLVDSLAGTPATKAA
jgi:hypothetical protein